MKYVYSILKLLETKGHCDFWRECPPMVDARRNLETCGAPERQSAQSALSAQSAMPPPGSATHTFFAVAGPASAVWPL